MGAMGAESGSELSSSGSATATKDFALAALSPGLRRSFLRYELPELPELPEPELPSPWKSTPAPEPPATFVLVLFNGCPFMSTPKQSPPQGNSAHSVISHSRNKSFPDTNLNLRKLNRTTLD
jgi:hypothetical protein